MDDPAVQTLEHAMQPIINEMFQHGPEEGCRLWEDPSHPLHQAIAILLRARVWVRFPNEEAAMLLEQHRRMEEG
jgi:hypothetical protein